MEVKYYMAGSYDSKEIPEYSSLTEYEELGECRIGSHQTLSFLVLEKPTELVVREVKQLAGGVKYFVDQYANPDSILFFPGGFFGEECLICGHSGTVSTTDSAKRLHSNYQKWIKKQCRTHVGRYYVSDAVRKLYGSVRLITMQTDEDEKYDLHLE